jgi:predicted  nucleic acid-binding Zn-ribbon protein
MMPNGSSTATSPSSPTLAIMQSLDDLNDKMNYVKAQQGLRHVRQQGENVPITMAGLHKMRANKEAIYKADIEAYKKVLDIRKVTGPMPKTIMNGPGTDQSSGSSNTQGAEVMALKIVMNKLKQDHKNMVAQLKQMDDDKKLREAQVEKDIQQRIDAAVQQQVEQKVQEALRLQLKTFSDANVEPTIKQLVDDQSKDMAAKFNQWTSGVALKVQSLSQDVSKLQTKHAVQTDSNKSLCEQVSKLDVALNNDKDGLLIQVKDIGNRCDQLLQSDSLTITDITTRLNTQKQSLEKFIKESAAENSQYRISHSQIQDHIVKAIGSVTKRLEALEPIVDEKLQQVATTAEKRLSQAITGLTKRIDALKAEFEKERTQNFQDKVDRATQDGIEKDYRLDADKKVRDIAIKGVREEFSKKLTSLDARISAIDQAQDKMARKDLLVELSTLKGNLSEIKSSYDTTVPKDLVQELSSLKARTSSLETAQDKSVQDDLKTLEKRVAAVEDSQDKIARADHDRGISKLKTGMPTATLESSDDLIKKVTNLETRMSTVENGIPLQVSTQIQNLNDFVEGVNSGLEEVEVAIHACKTDISSLKIELPGMFTSNLLPFQTRTNERLQKMNDTMSSHGEVIGKLVTTVSSQGGDIGKLQSTQSSQGGDIGKLKSTQSSHGDDISKLQTIQSSHGDDIAELQTVRSTYNGDTTKLQMTQPHVQAQQSRQDLSSRNNSRVNSPSLTGFESQIKNLSAEVQKVRQEVNIKISALDTEGIQKLQGQFDIINMAYQSLEHRYQNLNTAELHGMMVHQLQQMYPSAPAFLDQLKANHIQIQDLAQRARRVEQHFDPNSGDFHQTIKKLTGELHAINSSVTALQGDVQANPFKASSNNDTAYQDIQSALEKEANDRKEVVAAVRSDLRDTENKIYTTRHDLTKRIDEGQKEMQKIAENVARVDNDTVDNQERVGQVHSRVIRAEEDINKHAKRIDDVERNINTLDKGVLQVDGKANKLSERVSEVERSSLDINKRLPSLDELISWKDRIINTAGAAPIIVAKQFILAEFLETLNDNLGVPVQHMNLDQLKVNPFEQNNSG